MNALSAALEAQADALEAQAAALRALARDTQTDVSNMIDQHASPLGPRRHCAVVQKLLAQGHSGASIVGRRHLLTPEALQGALKTGLQGVLKTGPKRSRKTAPANDIASELDALIAS